VSFNVDMLMLQASNKYKTMVQLVLGRHPLRGGKILAFESPIQKLKKQKEKPTKDKKCDKDGKKGKKKGKPHIKKPAWMKNHLLRHIRKIPRQSMARPIGGALSTAAGEVTRSTNVKAGDWKRRQIKIQKP